MSLDNIQLNNRVVADLYKNALISLDNNQPFLVANSPKEFEFLGDNAKEILLLILEPEHKYLAEDDLSFLSKILTAVNLTLADVAIVNCHKNSFAQYEFLMENLNPGKVIFFEVKAEALGFPLNFANYKPQNYNGQTYLAAASLKYLQENLEDKKQFWAALQQLFST